MKRMGATTPAPTSLRRRRADAPNGRADACPAQPNFASVDVAPAKPERPHV